MRLVHVPHDKLTLLRLLMVAVGLVAVAGCGNKNRKAEGPDVPSRFAALKPRSVPPFMRGTVFERVYVMNVEPFPVSGYGLVANLNNTGDSRTSNTVREYMIRIMEKRGFGSSQLGFQDIPPQRVLDDSRFAIVRVDGAIPPGASPKQRFDLRISALPNNNTSSLAHGQLYRTDLKVDGANPRAPGVAVDIAAFGEGELFVNPAYALTLEPRDASAKASLREAVVIGGGVVQQQRPLALRVIEPSMSISRQIDYRLDELLQDEVTAQAKNEAFVEVTVPEKYKGDWEHFSGVITHVYFNTSPAFIAKKAGELAEEAVKRDAPLSDISYCWEALGESALPFITPLMTNPKPDVAFAAARAAAFLGEASSHTVLIQMAQTRDHPFQLNAVQTLGKLPPSPQINAMLRTLISSPHTLVRLEAYRSLALVQDNSIFSRNIEDKFVLDIIPGDGPPLLYAARRGRPRLAVFGRKPTLDLPVTFTAMDGLLSISSTPGKRTVTIYYRGPGVQRPIRIESNPDIAEIAARLGGAGPPEEPALPFTYCDVVAVVQALADQKKIVAAPVGNNKQQPVAFVLQELPAGTGCHSRRPTHPRTGASASRLARDGESGERRMMNAE